MPTSSSGGPAADEVAGGDGNDALAGGDGDDALDGGLGDDNLDAGPGDDRLLSRDGLADIVACGPGNDEVDADTLDQIAADCEIVTRVATAPPAGYVPDKPGTPTVEAGAETVQTLDRSRRVRVYATSSESGTVSASGFLEIAGLRLPLTAESRPVAIGGAGAAITYKLSRDRYSAPPERWRPGARCGSGSASSAPTPAATRARRGRPRSGSSAAGRREGRRRRPPDRAATSRARRRRR